MAVSRAHPLVGWRHLPGLHHGLSRCLLQGSADHLSCYEELGEPPGLDAAIFTGPDGYDMRFVNDTAHWMR
jgi:hypothetical protein